MALTTNASAQDVQDKRTEDKWDKVFPLSETVNHRKVEFKNQYGITLVGDLYTPKSEGNSMALAVCGPFGASKEQSSGLYAMEMAERGFVACAFDPSFTGESGGKPRRTSSPDINTEDFLAAVDYLACLPGVDEEKIDRFEASYDRLLGEKTELPAANIVNSRKFEVKTPDISIQVSPDRTDLIETRVIDGTPCLVIAISDEVEVNGVPIRKWE